MAETRIKTKTFFAYMAMTVSFMGSCSVFQGKVGSLQWTLLYYGGPLILVALSIYYIWTSREAVEAKNRNFFLLIFCVPRIMMLLYSCIIWLVSHTAFPYISRGISNTLFQCSAYICGVCIAYGLKDDILDASLAAVVTVFILAYVDGFIQNGFSFLHALNPFDPLADQFKKFTELHELAYIAGLCILMSLLTEKRNGKKKKTGLFWAAVIVFIVAWKRIGIFAAVVSYLYFALFSRISKRKKSFLIQITGIIGTIICIVYVSLIVSGAFVDFLKNAGIDMMGRDTIYDYFRQFAYFSPSFMGKGVGFVGRQFDYTTRADLYNMVSIRALHNDFFKMYIELGFFGFLAWTFWWLVKVPQIIQNRYSIKKAFVCLALILYAFVLYTTDNAESYSNFQMQLAAFITYASCLWGGQEAGNKTEKLRFFGK